MTNDELLKVLIECYLDPKFHRYYAGRWDVWCVQHNHFNAYKALLLKSNEQLNKLLTAARTRAMEIMNSPLEKALS